MTRVLLYSGGLDCYCLAHLWPPDVLLHVDMGTAYGKRETARLHRQPLPLGLPLTKARLPLAAWERPDLIIPGRNLHLLLVAAQYGDTLALAATAGDRVLDKSSEFAARASDLLTYLWRPQHWTEGKQVEVVLPGKHLTKTELVQRALAAGAPPDGLTGTWSCYGDGKRECGACKPCARKWVALVLNDVQPAVDCRPYVAAHFDALTEGRGPTEHGDVLAALTLTGGTA